MGIEALLGAIAGSGSQGKNGIDSTTSAETLSAMGAKYLEKHDFSPGDLVMWKQGLRNTKFPEYGKPAVVLEIVPGRRRPMKNDGDTYSGELAEVRIGVVDTDGDLAGFWFDINRFEPYRE